MQCGRDCTITLSAYFKLLPSTQCADNAGIEHSGYNALHPLVFINPDHFPSWMFSTTRHHDDHHKHFKGNYGGYLAVWDVLMGTTIPVGATSYKNARRGVQLNELIGNLSTTLTSGVLGAGASMDAPAKGATLPSDCDAQPVNDVEFLGRQRIVRRPGGKHTGRGGRVVMPPNVPNVGPAP